MPCLRGYELIALRGKRSVRADFIHTRCLLDAEVFLALKLKMSEDTQKGKTPSSHFLKVRLHLSE